MSDRLDTQIRSLVMELVDAAPPAPSLHELEDMERIRACAEESPRRPDGSAKAHDRTRKVRRSAALVASTAVLVLAGVLVVGGGGGTPQAGKLPLRSGTWKLADDVLSGTWSQYSDGPPRGSLTCPTMSVCYVMSGHYKTPYAGAPLLGVSLYVEFRRGPDLDCAPDAQWLRAHEPDRVRRCVQLCCWRHLRRPIRSCCHERRRRVVGARSTPERCWRSRHVVVSLEGLLCRARCNSSVRVQGEHRRHISLHHRRWQDVHRRAPRAWRFDAVAQLQLGPGLHGDRIERPPRRA